MINLKKNIKKALTLSLVLTLSVGILAGCSKKEVKVENENIYSYKTEFVGDNSKVVGIVSNLEYPKNYTYNSIEMKTDKKPYTLTVYLDEKEPDETREFFTQAATTFALIDNLDEINYAVKETEETLEQFNRIDVNTVLRENGEKETEELGKSEKDLKNFIEKQKDA